MSANVIDSMAISLGLEPGGFNAALDKLQTFIDSLTGAVNAFAAAMSAGMSEGMRAGMRDTANAAGKGAGEARQTGAALKKAGGKSAQILAMPAQGAGQAPKEMTTLEEEAKKLGFRLGGKLQGFFPVAAPITGTPAAGSTVKGYMRDRALFSRAAAGAGTMPAFGSLWGFINGGQSVIEHLLRKFGAFEETAARVRKGDKKFNLLKHCGPALGIAAFASKGAAIAMRLMGIAALSNPAPAITGLIAAGLLSDGSAAANPREASRRADAQVRQFGVQYQDAAVLCAWGTMAGMSLAFASGPIDNSSETTVNVGGITVNAQSNDPAGIARETGNEVRRVTATYNTGVRNP
ncbi:MAG: hypothetical protein LBJ14_03925 [Desulfarculales bacterium]|jgi:hypothetical protein|nr:hypothetical protein [Desulfarculales bacterium]